MYRACPRFGDFQNWIYYACHTFGECRTQINRPCARFGERPIWDFKILNAEVAGRRLCWGGGRDVWTHVVQGTRVPNGAVASVSVLFQSCKNGRNYCHSGVTGPLVREVY